MANQTTRSTVNEQQYAAPPQQKSGFNLSHRRYSSFMLGRTHVNGFQWVMPGDKMSGKNKGSYTLKIMNTPFVAPIDASQYNIFLPFRAIDKTFEKAFAPSKHNYMSDTWHVPTVNTRYLVRKIIELYGFQSISPIDFMQELVDKLHNSETLLDVFNDISGDTGHISVDDMLYGTTGYVTKIIDSLSPGGALFVMADKLYLADVLIDIVKNINYKMSAFTATTSVEDFVYAFMESALTPWVGWYSYYGEFRYKFLRPNDIYRLVNSVGRDWSNLQNWYDVFDDTPLCEYPLRVMYAIWYERFRNVDIEPINPNLPDWREFNSTSIFDLANGGNLCYLLYRPRPWYEDQFMTAQIDDMSRHVYAPIYATKGGTAAGHVQDYNNHDAGEDSAPTDVLNAGSKASMYKLSWRDQLDGQDKTIWCPVPANINDILSANDKSFVDVYGLDLNSLRQSQQLERYLKRNYLFGDEYQDRMLAHYNSRVSDKRINRPEIVSMSLNNANMSEEVANMSTDQTIAGQRTAIGKIATSGDDYTFFAEEFGLLVHLTTFMPLGSYDGICPQLLSYKVNDYPVPEFAVNNEEFGRKCEIADSAITPTFIGNDGSDNRFMFGRYPAYHSWRQRVDEVGGDFLNELQYCVFPRFFGMYSEETTPKLNYFFIHCRPSLGMFENQNPYDGQLYGDTIHECYVERVLPTPVEII